MKFTSPEQRPPTSRYWLAALGLSFVLTVVTTIALWQLRNHTLDAQERELGVLSLALTDEIDRGLQGAEAGMLEISAELHEGRLPVDGPLTNRDLFMRAKLMPLVQTIWLVDRGGKVMSASDATPLPDLASFSPTLAQLPENATA